jgi:hypothetical protein
VARLSPCWPFRILLNQSKTMWKELTEADVFGVLNALETDGYQAAAIAPGQDPVADSIALVTNHCRGYIADNAENALAEGLTLPERVHLSALHLIRVELLTRLDIEVSKDRVKASDAATRFFERVADGKVKVEQPTGPIDTSGSTQRIKRLSNHERQATRESLSGL